MDLLQVAVAVVYLSVAVLIFRPMVDLTRCADGRHRRGAAPLLAISALLWPLVALVLLAGWLRRVIRRDSPPWRRRMD